MCGGGQLAKGIAGGKAREQFENKLKDTLKAGHRYYFSMYVHLFDTIPASTSGEGQIVGINSFSAYFSDTVVNWRSNFDITRFTPQVQINQMVADTGHWVLLQDTFVATGGERYMCIGNFKPDSLLQWQLVDSIRNDSITAYYFYDDISLIDLDSAKVGIGILQLGNNKEQLKVYPNPANQSIVISQQSIVKTIEVYDVVGKSIEDLKMSRLENEIQIQVSDLSSGIYFIKTTDASGNVSNVKFVKE